MWVGVVGGVNVGKGGEEEEEQGFFGLRVCQASRSTMVVVMAHRTLWGMRS